MSNRSISTFLILTLFLLSCSKEVHTTRQIKKNAREIEELSNKLFQKFSEETFLVPRNLDSLSLNKSEIKLLTSKLKCPYVHLIYTDNKPRFFDSDSVVLFTRTGLPILGKQHNVVVDMRAKKRDSIPVDRNYLKYYKVIKGIYYIQDYMPEF